MNQGNLQNVVRLDFHVSTAQTDNSRHPSLICFAV